MLSIVTILNWALFQATDGLVVLLGRSTEQVPSQLKQGILLKIFFFFSPSLPSSSSSSPPFLYKTNGTPFIRLVKRFETEQKIAFGLRFVALIQFFFGLSSAFTFNCSCLLFVTSFFSCTVFAASLVELLRIIHCTRASKIHCHNNLQ